MIIANPIYDTVFKQLMQNTKIATYMIETLLSSGTGSSETITNISVQPQELAYHNPEGLALMRFDFMAIIKSSNGENKKVLIEIQKARNANDINRFRKYLGSQYMSEDEIDTAMGKKMVPLPIITIYLLGFTLAEWDTPAAKMGRFAEDLTTHAIIKEKCDFAEKLSHDSYYVQLPRIQPKFGDRLHKLLSIFEQNYFVDKQGMIKDYPYDIDDENIKTIVNLLHFTGTDPEEKKQIEAEAEAWRVFNTVLEGETEKLNRVIEEKDRQIEELKRLLAMK